MVRISKLRCISVHDIYFIVGNHANPDEMPHFVASCVGKHCVSCTLNIIIYELLVWVRHSYRYHVILPMLSHVRCLLVVLDSHNIVVK